MMHRRVLLLPAILSALCLNISVARGAGGSHDDAIAVVDELARLNGLDAEYRRLKATLAGHGINPREYAHVYYQRRSRANAVHGDPAALIRAADSATAALNDAARDRDLIAAYAVLLEQLDLNVPTPKKPDAKTGTEVVKAILRALKADAEEPAAALFHAEAARAIYKLDEPTRADVVQRLARDSKIEMCDRLLTQPNVLIFIGDEARHEERCVRLCDYANGVDWPRLYAAAGRVVALTDPDYLALLKKVLESLEKKKPGEPILYDKDSAWGHIVFAGSGNAQHEITDQRVIVDLGGNDTYILADGAKPPVLIVDFAGNDTYRAERDVGFACGQLGTAVLVDLDGDDTYATKGHALGSGLFGVGILADYAGNDTYTSEGGFAQGAAAFGIGLLVDGAGADTYKAHVYAQGFGLCDAAGALVELDGDDTYEAGGKYPSTSRYEENDESFRSWSMGVGMGLRGLTIGGIGILSDAAGDDRYLGDAFSAGASFFYGLGVLVDRAGNDTYRAFRHSLGAGVLYSNAVLLDGAGNDVYDLRFGSGLGCGLSKATGVLVDAAGDDTYTTSRTYDPSTDKYRPERGVIRAFGNNLSMGAAEDQAIGILIDEQGDDRYVCHDGRGQGFSPPFNEKGAQFGVLIDRGGDDYYSLLHENNSRWTNRNAVFATTCGGLGADYEAATRHALPEPSARRAYIWNLASSGEVASFREMIDVSYDSNIVTMTTNTDGAAFSLTLYAPIPAEYNKMIVKLWADRETSFRVRFTSPRNLALGDNLGLGGNLVPGENLTPGSGLEAVSPAARVAPGLNELKLDLGRAQFERTDTEGVIAWGGPSRLISSLTLEPADRGSVQIKLRSIVLFK